MWINSCSLEAVRCHGCCYVATRSRAFPAGPPLGPLSSGQGLRPYLCDMSLPFSPVGTTQTLLQCQCVVQMGLWHVIVLIAGRICLFSSKEDDLLGAQPETISVAQVDFSSAPRWHLQTAVWWQAPCWQVSMQHSVISSPCVTSKE